MVFVKVRETYDLKTTKNKMTVIGIHTPKPDIIKVNYPGLLMQCRAYRPYSADVTIACASVMPLDPLGVGTGEGAVSPEDVFNPILYKALSNKGMSQLEARINALRGNGTEIAGHSADVDVNTVTPAADEFSIYYGLLSNTHEWRHANPQSGLQMKGLKPLVYDVIANVGDQIEYKSGSLNELDYAAPAPSTGDAAEFAVQQIIGKPKEFPFINCTSYSIKNTQEKDPKAITGVAQAGFPGAPIFNSEVDVPWLNVVCGAIIVPPSRQHELFYRMVVEWTLEFSKLRPLGEIMNWTDLGFLGDTTHYQNYTYAKFKKIATGDDSSIMENDACMVSTNADVKKVM